MCSNNTHAPMYNFHCFNYAIAKEYILILRKLSKFIAKPCKEIFASDKPRGDSKGSQAEFPFLSFSCDRKLWKPAWPLTESNYADDQTTTKLNTTCVAM